MINIELCPHSNLMIISKDYGDVDMLDMICIHPDEAQQLVDKLMAALKDWDYIAEIDKELGLNSI